MRQAVFEFPFVTEGIVTIVDLSNALFYSIFIISFIFYAVDPSIVAFPFFHTIHKISFIHAFRLS